MLAPMDDPQQLFRSSATSSVDPEIENSRDVLSAYGNCTVVRVSRYFVVKYSQRVNIIKGENMLFVQKMTTITIPHTGSK